MPSRSSRDRRVVVVADLEGASLLTGLQPNTLARQCREGRRTAEKAEGSQEWGWVEVALEECQQATAEGPGPSPDAARDGELLALRGLVEALNATNTKLLDLLANEQTLRMAQEQRLAALTPPPPPPAPRWRWPWQHP